MKKLILAFSILFLGITLSIGQNATLSMGDYAGLSNGDTFLVSITLDHIDNSGTANCDGMQIFVLYDPAVAVVVTQTLNLNPNIPAWFWNTNVPAEGDWRGLFTNFGPPVTLSSGEKICDIEFQYIGDGMTGTSLVFDDVAKDLGGKLEKGETFIVVPGNTPYNMTLINGSVNMASGPNTWLGGSADWMATTNWSAGTVPNGEDVVIPMTANDPSIDLLVDAVGAMQIDFGAALYITDLGAITTGVMTNDGMIMMTSLPMGLGGSLISTGFAGTGTFQYDRYLSNGAPETHFGWHYVSSPVDNTVTGDFVGYWVKDFDEAAGMFNDIDPWIDCANPSAFNVAMMAGYGYSVKQDLDYTGTSPCPLPTGVVGDVVMFGGDYMTGTAYGAGYTELAMMPNVNTGDVGATLTGGGSNWNLMGNPYPSGWDYNFWMMNGDFDPVGMNDAIYFWDEDMDQYATYVAGVGTNGGTNEVPAAQGFFLEATGAVANMPMTFTDAARIHFNGPYFKTEVNDIVRLVASANGFSDETVIRFLDQATTGFDKQFDAKKLLSGGSDIPSLYTNAGSDIISINSQSPAELVPMAFTCSVSGTYTIEATETSDFTEVILEDVVTGEMTDLLTSSYTFDYTAGENADRFIVHFGALGTIENSFDNITIWSNENNIYVNVPSTVDGEIAVVNMMGQEVIRTDIAPGMNILPVNDINTYYIVNVIGSKDVKTGKVYIK